MAKIYLKIIDIDQFQDAKVTDESKGTHSVEVDDKDFTDVLDIFTKYLPKIQLHLPGLTEGLRDQINAIILEKPPLTGARERETGFEPATATLATWGSTS